MNFQETILMISSIVGFSLFVPILFVIPLFVLGKLMSYFADASSPKREKFSLQVFMVAFICCSLKTLFFSDINQEKVIFTVICFLVSPFYFANKQIAEQGGFKSRGIQSQQTEYFVAYFKGGWNTKYHWGTIVQSLIVLYAISL